MPEIDGLGEYPHNNPYEREWQPEEGDGNDAIYQETWRGEEQLIHEFWDELSELALQRSGWDGESPENNILDRMHFTVVTDDNDEFTGFRCSSPISWVDAFVVTLGEMLEIKGVEQ